MTPHQLIRELIAFIDTSPSPWHVIETIENMLKPWQFVRLEETDDWDLKPGGRYYVIRDDSSVIVFVLGRKPLLETGFRLIGAHTDSPGLRVRPNPINSQDGLVRVAVEIYGSPILATFTDRDLSLAGRICYKDDDVNIVRGLVKFDRPLFKLPNLAIHMNRNVNEEGLKLHKQNELPLLISSWLEKECPANYFLQVLQREIDTKIGELLAWDFAIYDTQKGDFWGADQEFYSDSQLDNLASCHAALVALLDDNLLNGDNTLVCAFFDHEEIGSESKQGAGGSFLPDVLARTAQAAGCRPHDFQRILAKSFLISADMAHAYHPNFPNAYDAQHKVQVNQGPAIKVNANQRYSSDGLSQAQFIDWCRRANVPYQFYSHRSDLLCGSTIGPITAAKLGLRSVDVGNPMWAMHSIRESAGVYDHDYLAKVFIEFFQSPPT